MDINIPSDPLRPYQQEAWNAFEEGKKKQVLVFHRRAGKDFLCFNRLIAESIKVPGIYYYVFPTYTQAQKILWDDKTKMSICPDKLIKNKNNAEMKIELFNGSIIRLVGSDKYDALRGTNPIGLVMSEYAYQHPMAWEVLRPIIAENRGWVIFNTTPNGKNHAHLLYRTAQEREKWFVSLKTVDDTKIIPKNILEEEREDMSREVFMQEYYCSFDIGMVGAYYAEQMEWLYKNGRVGDYPYNPSLAVDTFWDIGIDDSTAIWFLQNDGVNNYFIDYYETSGKGFDAILTDIQERGYRIRDNFLPHDFNQREFMIGESRLEYAKKRGFNAKIVPKVRVDEGIDAVRRFLKTVFFDKERCKVGISALENYHKEYDSSKKVYISHPHHDWSSHAADAMRYCAISLRSRRIDFTEEPKKIFGIPEDEFERIVADEPINPFCNF